MLVVVEGLCTKEFGGCVFLLRLSPAEHSGASGLGGEVEVAS